jgi:hypothetical protein
MHEVAICNSLVQFLAMSGIEHKGDFGACDLVGARLRLDQVVQGIVAGQPGHERGPYRYALAEGRAGPGLGQQPPGPLDRRREEGRACGKFHHRAVHQYVRLARDIDLPARQFIAHRYDVEIGVPAAELLEREIAEEIGMQCRRTHAVGEGELMHLPRQDLARIDPLDAVGNREVLVRRVEHDAGARGDEAAQRQLLVGAERRSCPEQANFRPRRGAWQAFVDIR